MRKCEITGGNEKVTDLRYLTAAGRSGSLFLRAKDAKLFQNLVEKAKKLKKDGDVENENSFDVTMDAFRRDRKKGKGGDFCVVALNSVHAIVAYDLMTRPIHEIESISADSGVLRIVDKSETMIFQHSFSKKRIETLVKSLHRSCHITKWQESRRLFCEVKLEIQNEMERTVVDKGKDNLIFIDYTRVSKALRKYEKAYELYHENIMRPEQEKEWENQRSSKTTSVRCFDCGQYIEIEKIDRHYLECPKVKPKTEDEIIFGNDRIDIYHVFLRPVMAILINKMIRSNTNMMNSTVSEKIKVSSGIVDMAEFVGIELVRKVIMDVLLDNYGA